MSAPTDQIDVARSSLGARPGRGPDRPRHGLESPCHQAGSHVDLILQQIASLPTLSPIAVRVMQAANAGDADLREIARLIESDPALTAKVLALCRRADWAVSKRVVTVDRAVVMLGLEAVRAAVLSVEIHEAFGPAIEKAHPSNRRASDPKEPPAFERKELWRHSIAVAAAAELIAEAQPTCMGGFSPQEAFLAGLLHDLGKVALDALLPKSFARVAALARERRMPIAEVERKVLGLDHHAAGKRLAEHWGLPHALQDVMWLHNQPAHLLPEVPHRVLIAVVSIADSMVRRLHVGWSGNAAAPDDPTAWCDAFGFDSRRLAENDAELIDRVARRCAHLGLDETTPASLLLESIARANGQLGHVTSLLDTRARDAARSETSLNLITKFLAAATNAGSYASAVAAVARHAAEVLPGSFLAIVSEPRDGAPWIIHRIDATGECSALAPLSRPAEVVPLRALTETPALSAQGASVLAWLNTHLRAPEPGGDLFVLPLVGNAGGLSSVLLHARRDAEKDLGPRGLAALASVWGSVLASASRHDGARRLGEQLAEANRSIAEMQTKLVNQRSMEKLAAVAAGAAHEMNNPLTVISGLAQALGERARTPDQQTAAAGITQAADKLSDLISSLHLFANPPKPDKQPGDVAMLLHTAARIASQRLSHAAPRKAKNPPKANISCDPGLAAARLDHEQITLALSELILNALQSGPKRGVEVRAAADPFDGRLVITVADDGLGMSSHALEHAFDPFFSELPAGRRPGLGLARARRYVDLHAGEITLESTPGKGTVARIILPDWRDADTPTLETKAA